MTPDAQRIASIAAALVLAYGVVALDWPPYWVLALFWLENVAIGVATLAKLVFAGLRTGQPLGTLAMAAFFCVHYGMFCAVHGVFVATLFGQQRDSGGDMAITLARMVGDVVREPPGMLALASIVIAVVIDLVRWIAAHRDDENPKLVGETMGAPYGRIVVLHVVILGGAFLMQLFKAPAAAALLLVALKLLADLGALRLGRRSEDSGTVRPQDGSTAG
jgi:hypothetical protein